MHALWLSCWYNGKQVFCDFIFHVLFLEGVFAVASLFRAVPWNYCLFLPLVLLRTTVKYDTQSQVVNIFDDEHVFLRFLSLRGIEFRGSYSSCVPQSMLPVKLLLELFFFLRWVEREVNVLNIVEYYGSFCKEYG